jgi:hypothetical protein
MTILRYALTVLMLLHGVAHLPAFVTSWRLQALPDFPYHTQLLRGRLDVHDAGMRVLGSLWLLAALGFCLSSIAALANSPLWIPLGFGVALLSTALCILEWPLARVGLWVNLALLASLALAARFGS